MRRPIVALAAALVIGATLIPAGASAAMHRGPRSFHSSHAGSHFTFSNRAVAHNRFAFRNRVVVNNRFAFRNRFVFRDRFAFRHHVPFRHRFFVHRRFAFADDDCFVVRHVWTHWGWRWRRVWVCDSAY